MSEYEAPRRRNDGPLTPLEQLRKDVSESPGSERETAAKQDDPVPAANIDGVKVLPGTGGPDDVGDIEVEPEDLAFPRAATTRGDPERGS